MRHVLFGNIEELRSFRLLVSLQLQAVQVAREVLDRYDSTSSEQLATVLQSLLFAGLTPDEIAGDSELISPGDAVPGARCDIKFAPGNQRAIAEYVYAQALKVGINCCGVRLHPLTGRPLEAAST